MFPLEIHVPLGTWIVVLLRTKSGNRSSILPLLCSGTIELMFPWGRREQIPYPPPAGSTTNSIHLHNFHATRDVQCMDAMLFPPLSCPRTSGLLDLIRLCTPWICMYMFWGWGPFSRNSRAELERIVVSCLLWVLLNPDENSRWTRCPTQISHVLTSCLIRNLFEDLLLSFGPHRLLGLWWRN